MPVAAVHAPQRPKLPIIRHLAADVGQPERARLDQLAARLIAAEPALAATDVFRPLVRSGLNDGPAVAFEDHSEVPLFPERGNSALDYRSLLLAADGDIVIVASDRNKEFEVYCRDVLRLGRPHVLAVPSNAEDRPTPLPLRVAREAAVMQHLVATARQHGGLILIPYLGSGAVWVLAAAIAEQAGVPVKVVAGPPRLVRRVNDKLWFGARVTEVLGTQAVPAFHSAFGPAALAARIRQVARHCERLVVKVPDSAGSLGNAVLEAAPLRGRSFAGLRDHLVGVVAQLGAAGRFPLMVEVWDEPVIASPSVQLWIPSREGGLPIIEGLFEQTIEGERAEFVGAGPCVLPPGWHERIADEAAKLAYLLQALGFFGRCSFDAVLAGASTQAARLHWIECNGRWGGVSIPLTLANRLVGDWTRRAFLVVQRTQLTTRPRPLAAAIEELTGRLFGVDGHDKGLVLLTPGHIVRGHGFHFLVLAENEAAARDEAAAASRILGEGSAAARH